MFASTVDRLGDLSFEALAGELRLVQERRCGLEADEAALLAEYERRDREAWLPAAGTAAWETQVTGTARYQARRRVTLARGIEALPELGEALAAAEVDFEHAYRISLLVVDEDRAAAVMTDARHLIDVAQGMKADQFRRWLDDWDRRRDYDKTDERDQSQHRSRFLRSWTADDGATEGRFRLDRLDARLVLGALQGIVDEERRVEQGHPDMAGAGRSADQRRADALVEVCKRAAGADAATGRRARPTISALMTYQDLVTALEAEGRAELADGIPISPAAIRRLACEADIIPIVLGTDGMPLDVGRKFRTATWPQRAALRARYSHCAWPGCDRPFDWCEIHHLIAWEVGGRTDLDNLIPLCGHHHDLVHVCKWPVTRETDGRLRVHDWPHQPKVTVKHGAPPGRTPRPPDVRLN